MRSARDLQGGVVAMWLFLACTLMFLYAPLIPPVINSFADVGVNQGLFSHYAAILSDRRLVRAATVSLQVGVLVAIIAPLLALLAAEAIRIWRIPKIVLGVILIPLFIPGISMGLASALFFKTLGIAPSLLTITMVQVVWALPFALMIILTVLANFEPAYREAAYMCGATRMQAFFEVELPQIHQGILGAAVFSLILSFNETIRTSIVQGGQNTLQTYLWSQYQQVGLAPNLYALMAVLIMVTLLLIALLAWMDFRSHPADDRR